MPAARWNTTASQSTAPLLYWKRVPGEKTSFAFSACSRMVSPFTQSARDGSRPDVCVSRWRTVMAALAPCFFHSGNSAPIFVSSESFPSPMSIPTARDAIDFEADIAVIGPPPYPSRSTSSPIAPSLRITSAELRSSVARSRR